MTEADWLHCTDPQPMLEFLRDKASDRKLRLFAVACLRRVWHRLGEDAAAQIELSERVADGAASMSELRAARSQLGARAGYSAAWAANNALHAVLEARAWIAANRAIEHGVGFVYYFTMEQRHLPHSNAQADALAAREVERKDLTELVREVFGNPFRPVTIDPTCVTPPVTHLANTIYDTRAFDRMPGLAHALAQAGCHDPVILAHCRSGGEHVRGCWVIDLVLRRG
jgi:hypothetical protein